MEKEMDTKITVDVVIYGDDPPDNRTDCWSK